MNRTTIARFQRTLTAACLLAALLSVGIAPAAPFSAQSAAIGERTDSRETGRVIVGYARGKSVSALGAAERLGGDTVDAVASGGFAVVEPPAGTSAAQFAKKVSRASGVRFAEPEHLVYAAVVPSDDRYPSQWNLSGIGFPSAWNSTQGSGVRVAVLDTGIMKTHLDLAGQVIKGENFIGSTGYDDLDGHGTHVAGIIAAKMNNGGIVGVAPQADLLIGKVLGTGGVGTETDLAEGIRWAADQGADVINMSIETLEYNRVIEEACAYAQAKGVLIVAASGNEGANRISYPALMPGVVSVGALEKTTTTIPFAWASFSNLGYELDITAPGAGIVSSVYNPATPSTTNAYALMSGTSMASPHVAGVLALALARNPSLTPGQLQHALRASALDVGVSGRDPFYGAGVVKADAMTQILPETDFDGQIPGRPLALGQGSDTSSTAGDLSATDTDDVYEFHVRSGDVASFTLTGASGTDFELQLYGRDATTTAGAPLQTGSAGSPLVYEPDATGSVYLRVHAISGAGTYALDYGRVHSGAADDDIPGVAAPASPRDDTLESSGDTDDVFAISLTEGEGLTARMSNGEAHTDFDLWLFSDEASTVGGMTGLVAGSMEDGSTEELSFSAGIGAGGTYYLDPTVYYGGGAYTLSYKKGTATKLSLSAPTSCAWSGSATVSGKLLTHAGGAVANRRVTVWATTDLDNPSGWEPVAYDATDSTGYWKTSVKPRRKTYYIAEFAGDSFASGGTYTAVESASKIITPRAYLTRPYAPKTTYRNRTWTAYGYLRPRHTTGSHTVKISCYRWSTTYKKWVFKKSVYATNYYYTKYTTKYKKKLSLPSRGKWKLVASVKGDTVHVATKSYSRYVTVK